MHLRLNFYMKIVFIQTISNVIKYTFDDINSSKTYNISHYELFTTDM